MDINASHFEAAAEFPRGGFWRRWAATLVDSIVVTFPFQFLAAVLFAVQDHEPRVRFVQHLGEAQHVFVAPREQRPLAHAVRLQ